MFQLKNLKLSELPPLNPKWNANQPIQHALLFSKCYLFKHWSLFWWFVWTEKLERLMSYSVISFSAHVTSLSWIHSPFPSSLWIFSPWSPELLYCLGFGLFLLTAAEPFSRQQLSSVQP